MVQDRRPSTKEEEIWGQIKQHSHLDIWWHQACSSVHHELCCRSCRVLPGRVPDFRRDDIKLLPSSHTKKVVYCKYKESLKDTHHRVVGDSSFYSLWQQLVPFVISTKPMTDLCWTCQKNNTLIYRFVLSLTLREMVWYTISVVSLCLSDDNFWKPWRNLLTYLLNWRMTS